MEDLEKSVREAVLAALKISKPNEAALSDAADLAGRAVRDALARGVPPEKAFIASSQGAFSALMLLERSLPEASIHLLQNVNETAQQVSVDPLEAMTWSLTGMARVAVLAAEEVKYAIRSRLDQSFTDCGTLFINICQKEKSAR